MEKVKRVVFTVSNDLNYDQRMQRICTTLHQAGYDVTLVGRNRKSSKPLVPQPYKQVRLNLWFDKGKLFYVELNLRLFFYLLTKPFDVVCGIDLDTVVPCWSVSRLKARTCVYDAHELFTEVPEVIDRPSVQQFWKAVESFIVKRVKYFYTVSESVAEEFAKRYGNKPKVIRNLPLRSNKAPVSLSLSKTGYDEAASTSHFESHSVTRTPLKHTIIYRGAVNAGRGVEQTIEAMTFINDVDILIAGDGDLLEEAKQLAQRRNVNDRVKFTGYATPDELNHYTKSAWLGLNLLDDSSANYRYSLANKFFDYIQCGVPQLTMRFPEYERVNAQYNVAVLLDDMKPETIATAVNNLLRSPDRYSELQLNCIKAAADLCWENERTKLLDFYRNLP